MYSGMTPKALEWQKKIGEFIDNAWPQMETLGLHTAAKKSNRHLFFKNRFISLFYYVNTILNGKEYNISDVLRWKDFCIDGINISVYIQQNQDMIVTQQYHIFP